MAKFRDFLALVKIGICGSTALTALAGFALASAGTGRSLPLGRGALAVLGTALLVAGACAANNWIDRDIDALMRRTRDRPTARGAMSAFQVLGIAACLGLSGLALLFAATPTAAALGLAGAAIYLLPYSLWAKRRGPSSLYVGGIAGSIPPLIGWAAADPRLGGPAWLLFAFLALWQQAHVRVLALKRAAEYRAAGVPMAGLPPAPGDAVRERRARAAALAWAAAALPFPPLIISLARLPMTPALAASIAACALGAAWPAWGLLRLRSASWPARMFAASLAYLVLAFCAIAAAGLRS